MRLRRYLPVIAGVVFALSGGSALIAWLAPPPSADPFADEQGLAPIPERAPRPRRAARPKPAPAAPQGCAAKAPAATPATRPDGAPRAMLEQCPGGTPP